MPLTVPEFRASTGVPTPPPGLSVALTALWWDAKGDWTRAHDAVAADETGCDAAWVHGYLHRVEGDGDNARYWYVRAKRPVPDGALEDEWNAIAGALLDDSP